ncbi:polysaccharide deacetylase family protein [Virgibacillus dakarensis]|uniref:polysaccharide deacetylase family protein n=1 Tax=Lentibacillus sp. TaxID=1925746 RepID=UPI0012D9C1B5|nr:polysaccharide deacetylase family protein [Virgibacillus dakarensis]
MLKSLVSFAIMLSLLGTFFNPLNMFSEQWAMGSPVTAKEIKNNALYKKIKAYNKEHKIPAIDARIDNIWGAIPGYNGLAVDVKTSYNIMEQDGHFDVNQLVYKQIPPDVHLEDLDSAPIYRGNPQKPMVALLINVAWGNEYIPEILKVLKNSGVKATFFFDGSWVKKNPDFAKTIKQAGHEIGNHAFSHPDLNQRSKSETIRELKKTNNIIKRTLGIKPEWFAPPSGSYNKTTVEIADQLGMETILWTVDTVDWRKPIASEMVRRVVSKVKNGTMILMHPTKPVAKGLKTMLSGIKKKGYQVGSVSELMDEERIDVPSVPGIIKHGL